MTRAKTGLSQQQKSVIRKIRDLHRSGKPLNITAVKRKHPRLLQRAYAVKPFWGWKRALEAAGIAYSDIKVQVEPDVRCLLCGTHFRVLMPHLRMKHDCTPTEYRYDYPDADLVCEELRARAMGRQLETGKKSECLLLPHWEPLWSPEYVLDRIAELHRQGHDLNAKYVADHDPVEEHAVRHFGSWDAALERVGIDPASVRRLAPYRVWTPARVLYETRQRHQKGLNLHASALTRGKHRDDMLLLKGRLFFGSWPKAIRAAGLDYDAVRWQPSRRYPTPAAVLKEIRRRKRNGLTITSVGIRKSECSDAALFLTVRELFGSWAGGIKAAGLDYERISRKPRNPYTTKASVVAEIRRRKKAGLPLTVSALRAGKHRDGSLVEAALKHYDRWSAATKAARVTYHKGLNQWKR